MIATTANTADVEPTATRAPLLMGLTVLFVDDADSCETLVAAAQHFGGEAYSATSVTAARALIAERHVDLIVCDIRVPGSGAGDDGCALIAGLRSARGAIAGTPAVAITSLDDAFEHDRALEAGFQTVLLKPLVIPQLMRRLAQVARRWCY